MSLVANEQAKLTANWPNAIASGIIITGVIAPIVAALYGVPGPSQTGPATLALVSIIWLATGTVLHVVARSILGRLVP